jgi:hypothetical protein
MILKIILTVADSFGNQTIENYHWCFVFFFVSY